MRLNICICNILAYTTLGGIVSHVEVAMSKGKTEDQICEELGDVHELAKSYLNITPNKLPKSLRETKTETETPTGSRVFVVLFNIFIGVPIALWWAILDILGCVSLVGNIIFFITRFAIIGDAGAYLAPLIMFQLATFFGILFGVCLLYFGISLLFRALKKYIRWNRKLWVKGF